MLKGLSVMVMKPMDEYKLWEQLHIAVAGVERCCLPAGQTICGEVLSMGAFLLVSRGHGTVRLDGAEAYSLQSSQVLHVPKGRALAIAAHADAILEYWLLSYRAALPAWRRWLPPVPDLSPVQSVYDFVARQPLILYELLLEMERLPPGDASPDGTREPDNGMAVSRAGAGHSRLLLKSLFYRFIAELVRQKQEGGALVEPDLVRQTLAYVRQHYNKPLTLEQLGSALGYHAKYLARKFKRQTGYSPIDYMIRLRIGKACGLLAGTDASIKAIALTVGYEDMFYFNRIFKKQTGCSPSQFRKQSTGHVPHPPYKEYPLSMEEPPFPWYSEFGNENQYQPERKGERAMLQMNKAVGLLVGVSLLLAACGGGGGGQTNNASAAPNVASAPQAGASQQPQQAATKKVNTLFGEVEIPVKPGRIAAIQYVSSLLAVGVQPVASTDRVLDNPYFEGLKEEIEVVGGSASDVSFEKLITLDPELIVVMTSDEEEYEKYKKIAPTIPIPWGSFQTIEEEVAFFGSLLDRTEEADAWIAEYKERISAAKAKVDKAVAAGATFTIFEWAEKSLNLFGELMGRGGIPIYRNLELEMPQSYAKELEAEGSYRQVSFESIGELAGDYIILTTDKTLAEVEADSVWANIEAVKNKRVYVWPNARSYFNDPLSVLLQTEELADWLASTQAE